MRRSRAVLRDSSQVIVLNGSQQALDLIARVLVDRGDTVAIEDPQYQGTREIFRAARAKLHPVAVDRDGLDPRKLPRGARLAFVTPSHQFPTGAILPLARRLALLDWARREHAVIVEDDYDGEFRYDGQALESLQGLDREGRVIYVGTFSRTVFSALRIGLFGDIRTKDSGRHPAAGRSALTATRSNLLARKDLRHSCAFPRIPDHTGL